MASGVIKGITVEIGGDTTKLGKALGDTEKKSRSLQVELKQIEKLLKFDPTNTELLAQKQDVLKDSIEETSKKLNTLKEAESQVIEQFERGEIAENQLRAFQREITKTEKDLSDMKSELSSTETAMKNLANGTDSAEKHTKEYKESVKDAKEELEEFKTKASETFDTLKTGATVLGGAVGATGGYALKLSTDFDQAFNTLITKTGASAEEMESLNTAMENVYANNFGESIEDVANSMATVKQQTDFSGRALEGMTENALLMRDTFDFEVNESVRSAKMLMDQYGISGEEAYNLIAQGAQNGLDKNGDLLDTINEYASHFKNLGLDAEDMFNMLANGADNGTFSVDKLGDAVKEFGIRVIDDSDSTAEAFKSMGLNVEEMEDKFTAGGDSAKEALSQTVEALFAMENPVARNTAGVALFGTMWEDLGEDGIKALTTLDGGISTTKDALDDINNIKYNDLGSALQGLKRTLDTEVIEPLGDELKPAVEEAIGIVKDNAPQIKEVLSTVVEKVGEFVGFVVDNKDAILATVTGIGTGLLLWNVASMITGVVNAINAFKLANEGATIAQALLNAVMNANPIAILITAIGAVVAGITTFILTNEDARAKFLEIWESIKSFGSEAISILCNFFTVTVPEAWGSFTAWLGGFIDSIVQWFSELPGKIETWLNQAIENVSAWVSDLIAKAEEAGSEFVNNVVNFITELPGKVLDWLTTALDNVATWASNIMEKGKEAGSDFVNEVVNYVKELPAKFQNWLTETKTKITTWVSEIKDKATQAGKDFVAKVIEKVTSLPGDLKKKLDDAKAKVTTWGTELFTKGKNAIGELIKGIKEKASNIANDVKSIGKDVVSGVWNGVQERATKFYEDIKGFFSGLVGKAKTALDIHSPSRVFEKEIGENIVKGLIKGVNNQKKNAKKSAEELSKLYITSANSKLTTLKKANKLTLAQEETFWNQVAKSCKKGTTGYEQALANAKKAKSDLNKSLTKLDEQYASDVESVKTKLKKEIQELTDAYDKAVSARQQSITASLKLFDKFEADEGVSKDDLTANLKGQVEALKEWDATLDSLRGRNGMDSELLNNLESMGVSSLETLKSLNSMTDEELAEYVSLFREKNAVALERAEAENESLKAESEKQIIELIENANKSLNDLEKTYTDNLKELGVSIKDQSKSIGKNIVDGLKSGIESQNNNFKEYLKNFLDSIVSTSKDALSIKSPSRVFADVIGKQIPAGIAQGIDNNIDVATDSIHNMSDDLINSANINRKLSNTFGNKSANNIVNDNKALLSKLDGIYERLSRLQIVLDTGTLVGETIDKIDASLANKQLLSARGV